jgi:hypothetical protein
MKKSGTLWELQRTATEISTHAFGQVDLQSTTTRKILQKREFILSSVFPSVKIKNLL